MDLLEYQGKQLFAKHGVPVPAGRPAKTVEEAVDAAQELGFPCVIKAQVLIMALDAKVTVDASALYRHPDTAEFRTEEGVDPQESMARERGLTYVALDGNIGILGNGAGLVMSTLDVVAQAGGKPANFLDAGGGSKAEAITQAVESTAATRWPRSGETPRSALGGDPLQRQGHLDGTNDKEGRQLLAEANLPNVHAESTLLGAAKRVVELAG